MLLKPGIPTSVFILSRQHLIQMAIHFSRKHSLHRALPTSSFLPGFPLTSQLLQFSLLCSPPHPQHSHMFYSFVFTFTLWMVSASSRALNAICQRLPNLDFQTRSPVNSWLLYPQHVTSITARGHLLTSKVVVFKGELFISPSPNLLLQLSLTLR